MNKFLLLLLICANVSAKDSEHMSGTPDDKMGNELDQYRLYFHYKNKGAYRLANTTLRLFDGFGNLIYDWDDYNSAGQLTTGDANVQRIEWTNYEGKAKGHYAPYTLEFMYKIYVVGFNFTGKSQYHRCSITFDPTHYVAWEIHSKGTLASTKGCITTLLHDRKP